MQTTTTEVSTAESRQVERRAYCSVWHHICHRGGTQFCPYASWSVQGLLSSKAQQTETKMCSIYDRMRRFAAAAATAFAILVRALFGVKCPATASLAAIDPYVLLTQGGSGVAGAATADRRWGRRGRRCRRCVATSVAEPTVQRKLFGDRSARNRPLLKSATKSATPLISRTLNCPSVRLHCCLIDKMLSDNACFVL